MRLLHMRHCTTSTTLSLTLRWRAPTVVGSRASCDLQANNTVGGKQWGKGVSRGTSAAYICENACATAVNASSGSGSGCEATSSDLPNVHTVCELSHAARQDMYWIHERHRAQSARAVAHVST